jgi:hypothetical protein
MFPVFSVSTSLANRSSQESMARSKGVTAAVNLLLYSKEIPKICQGLHEFAGICHNETRMRCALDTLRMN